jgi:hypothetical protein
MQLPLGAAVRLEKLELAVAMAQVHANHLKR